MMTAIIHRALGGVILAAAVSGCASLPANQNSSSNNPPLPQPSGSQPVPAGPSASSSVSATNGSSPMAPAPASSNSTTDTSSNASTADAGAGATFDNLEIADDSLKGKLAVLRVGSGKTDENLMTVFAGVKNRTSHPLAIEFQTIYKDDSDNPMTDGKGSWVPITLKPHEEFEYRSVAISAAATDFLVRIRRAQLENTP